MRLDRELVDAGGHADRVEEVGDWNGDCHPHGGYLHQRNRQRFRADAARTNRARQSYQPLRSLYRIAGEVVLRHQLLVDKLFRD